MDGYAHIMCRRNRSDEKMNHATIKISRYIIIVLAFIAVAMVTADVVVDHDGKLPVIRVVRDGKQVFEYRFETEQHIYASKVSPSGYYLLIWHMDYPPIRLKIFRIDDGKMLADFVPGFGGQLQWTFGDKILHYWGCGTNCQSLAVYDITGGTVYSDAVSGLLITSRGYYVVYPTVMPTEFPVYKYDVNTGTKTILKDSLPSMPDSVELDANDLVIVCPGYDEIRIPID